MWAGSGHCYHTKLCVLRWALTLLSTCVRLCGVKESIERAFEMEISVATAARTKSSHTTRSFDLLMDATVNP